MDFKIPVSSLQTPEDIAALAMSLSEMSEALDILYTTTAPNGNVSARIGKIAMYYTGSAYQTWQNTDGGTTWIRIDQGAVTVTDEKVKASSDDPTADYLDGKVANSIVIASEKLALSGDSASPGNSQYYGTDSGGTKGFHALPSTPSYSQFFSSSGTFTAPTGVTMVYVTMVGGGGGGGQDQEKGGGSGAYCIKVPYAVTPGNSYAVVVGAGGTGDAHTGDGGTDGGETSFNADIVCNGGQNGTAALGGGVGGAAAPDVPSPTTASGGYKTFAGGNGGAAITTTGGGGNGGFAGRGGAGGPSEQPGAAGTGHGSGGGGAGGSYTSKSGDGAPGFVLIEW